MAVLLGPFSCQPRAWSLRFLGFLETSYGLKPPPHPQVRGSEGGGGVPSPLSPDGTGAKVGLPGPSCRIQQRQDQGPEKPSKAERWEGSTPFLPCSHLPGSFQAPPLGGRPGDQVVLWTIALLPRQGEPRRGEEWRDILLLKDCLLFI